MSINTTFFFKGEHIEHLHLQVSNKCRGVKSKYLYNCSRIVQYLSKYYVLLLLITPGGCNSHTVAG